MAQAIVNKAGQSEIAIEYGSNSARASPNDRAKEIALSAYAARTARISSYINTAVRRHMGDTLNSLPLPEWGF